MSKLTKLTKLSFIIVVSNISYHAEIYSRVYFDELLLTSDNNRVVYNKQRFPACSSGLTVKSEAERRLDLLQRDSLLGHEPSSDKI